MSGEHWFGIEPELGRDVLMQLVYGMRTSLFTALVVTILMVTTGVLIGLVGGYFGGKVDYWLGRVTDFLMSFPSQLFFIATMPVVTAVFVDPSDETPTYLRAVAMITVLWFLGWMSMARLVRSQVLSLREREFVEAAKVTGASPWRIIRKELLPNIFTPVLVQGTYMLPSAILSVAFLSFVGVGFVEPTPDWGRMFAIAAADLRERPDVHVLPRRGHGDLRGGLQPSGRLRAGRLRPQVRTLIVHPKGAATPAPDDRKLQGSRRIPTYRQVHSPS